MQAPLGASEFESQEVKPWAVALRAAPQQFPLSCGSTRFLTRPHTPCQLCTQFPRLPHTVSVSTQLLACSGFWEHSAEFRQWPKTNPLPAKCVHPLPTPSLSSLAHQRPRTHPWPTADSATPWTIYSPGNSPGQNTGVGSLLQGIFPTQ